LTKPVALEGLHELAELSVFWAQNTVVTTLANLAKLPSLRAVSMYGYAAEGLLDLPSVELVDIVNGSIAEVQVGAPLRILMLLNCGVQRLIATEPLKNLQVLQIPSNELHELPDFSVAEDLVYLDVKANFLAELPDLHLMAKLEWFLADSNRLLRLPRFHPSAAPIVISATDNRLVSVSDLPPATRDIIFQSSPLLESINVTGCSSLLYFQAQHCPSLKAIFGLDSLVSVKVVLIDDNVLEDISGLAAATGIEVLGVRGNFLKVLPDMSKWRALQKLNAADNKLQSVLVWPPSSNLTEVALFQNNISVLGDISGLTGLQYFWVPFNNLRVLPDFSENVRLRQIWASGNRLESLPPLQHLENLERLICEGNALAEVPILPASLQRLNLGDNLLTTVDVEHLWRLQYLDVDRNRLSRVPEFDSCIALVSLDLSHNVIADPVADLQGCVGLEKVDVSFNLLSEASWILPQVASGVVNLTGNCFGSVDDEMWDPWSVVHFSSRESYWKLFW